MDLKKTGSRLGNLFSMGPSTATADTNDALKYVRPVKPSASTPTNDSSQSSSLGGGASASSSSTAAPTPTSQQFIYTNTVNGMFMLSDGRYVDKGGGGVLGCVIVGANTDYNLMFYDSAKRTVFLAPITKYLTVKGMSDNYVSIEDSSQADGQWSALFKSSPDVSKFIKTIAITKLHQVMHSMSCIPSFEELEGGNTDGPALSDGDTAGIRFTMYDMSQSPSVSPSTIIDDSKIIKESGTTLSKVKIGDEGGAVPGLGMQLRGIKSNGRRLVLIPNKGGTSWVVVDAYVEKNKRGSVEAPLPPTSVTSSSPPLSSSSSPPPSSLASTSGGDKETVKERMAKLSQAGRGIPLPTPLKSSSRDYDGGRDTSGSVDDLAQAGYEAAAKRRSSRESDDGGRDEEEEDVFDDAPPPLKLNKGSEKERAAIKAKEKEREESSDPRRRSKAISDKDKERDRDAELERLREREKERELEMLREKDRERDREMERLRDRDRDHREGDMMDVNRMYGRGGGGGGMYNPYMMGGGGGGGGGRGGDDDDDMNDSRSVWSAAHSRAPPMYGYGMNPMMGMSPFGFPLPPVQQAPPPSNDPILQQQLRAIQNTSNTTEEAVKELSKVMDRLSKLTLQLQSDMSRPIGESGVTASQVCSMITKSVEEASTKGEKTRALEGQVQTLMMENNKLMMSQSELLREVNDAHRKRMELQNSMDTSSHKTASELEQLRYTLQKDFDSKMSSVTATLDSCRREVEERRIQLESEKDRNGTLLREMEEMRRKEKDAGGEVEKEKERAKEVVREIQGRLDSCEVKLREVEGARVKDRDSSDSMKKELEREIQSLKKEVEEGKRREKELQEKVSSAPPPSTTSSASAEALEEIEKLKLNLKEMKAAAKAQIKAMKDDMNSAIESRCKEIMGDVFTRVKEYVEGEGDGKEWTGGVVLKVVRGVLKEVTMNAFTPAAAPTEDRVEGGSDIPLPPPGEPPVKS